MPHELEILLASIMFFWVCSDGIHSHSLRRSAASFACLSATPKFGSFTDLRDGMDGRGVRGVEWNRS
jgi:hypothetical protein